jgi:hypothetical protein
VPCSECLSFNFFHSCCKMCFQGEMFCYSKKLYCVYISCILLRLFIKNIHGSKCFSFLNPKSPPRVVYVFYIRRIQNDEHLYFVSYALREKTNGTRKGQKCTVFWLLQYNMSTLFYLINALIYNRLWS